MTILSQRTIEILRESLPVVEDHRPAIINDMAASLAAADPDAGERRASGIAASLVELLIDQARNLTGSGELRGIAAIRREHARNDILRFHLSRFGDALAAVMVDAAGEALPRQVGGAWVDAFWAVMKRVNDPDEVIVAFERPLWARDAEALFITSRA